MQSNPLKKVSEKSVIETLVLNNQKSQKRVLGWKIVDGKKVTLDLKIRVVRAFKNEMIITVKNLQDKNKLKDFTVSSESLNIFFAEDLVLFQSSIKSRDYENNDIVLEVPEMIAHVDRRKSIRYEVSSIEKVKVSFTKEVKIQSNPLKNFIRDCHDISTGGLSFFISRTEKKFFSLNDNVIDLVLSFNNEKIRATAKVVSIFDLEPNRNNMLNYRVCKVCFKLDIKNSSELSSLEDFILEKIDLERAVS